MPALLRTIGDLRTSFQTGEWFESAALRDVQRAD